MDIARITDLFKAHINPGQLHFMKLLGFHKVKQSVDCARIGLDRIRRILTSPDIGAATRNEHERIAPTKMLPR